MDAATAAAVSASLLEYFRTLDLDKELNEHQRTVLRNVTSISELVYERCKRRCDDDHDGPRPHKMLKTPEAEGDVAGDGAALAVSKATDKHTRDAQTRAGGFLADALRADAQAVSLAELTALITSTKVRDHAPLEDAALRRALVGYMAPLDGKDDAVSWGSLRRGAALMSAAPLAGENNNPQSPLIVFCARTLDLERDGDLERRVCKRGGWLSVDPFGDARWITELVQKIKVLRFDLDYNLLVAGEGGKKRQTDIHERLFQTWLLEDKKDVDVTTSEGDALKKSYRQYFDHQRRARIRLHDLYQSFGPAILLDPFWTMDTCFHHRSKAFPKLLEIVLARFVDDRDEDNRHVGLSSRNDDIVSTLCALAEYLGGPTLKQYVSVKRSRSRWQMKNEMSA